MPLGAVIRIHPTASTNGEMSGVKYSQTATDTEHNRSLTCADVEMTQEDCFDGVSPCIPTFDFQHSSYFKTVKDINYVPTKKKIQPSLMAFIVLRLKVQSVTSGDVGD